MDTFACIICIVMGACCLVLYVCLLYDLLVGFDKPKIKKKVCLNCLYRPICKHFSYNRCTECRFVKRFRKYYDEIIKHR